MNLADGLVASGGPSAPVWAFFTAISVALLAVIGQQISARKAANEAKIASAKAAENSLAAKENTANISNGFAGSVGNKLDRIISEQIKLSDAFRDHLEWHVNNPPQKGK